MSSAKFTLSTLLVLTLVWVTAFAQSTSKEANERVDTQVLKQQRREALAKFNSLIGSWRGVGRPRRYRAEGAWKENAEWIWAFEQGGPSLEYVIQGGKQLRKAELFWDERSREYRLEAINADDSKQTYTGKLTKNKLVLTSKPDKEGSVHRLQLTMLNAKRSLVLFQKQPGGKGPFVRVNEVGYTRQGTRLAKDTLGGPECIVTGGLGTMPVKHAGKTYYVCCTGCRQAFDDDPDEIVQDYLERVKKAKADASNRGEKKVE